MNLCFCINATLPQKIYYMLRWWSSSSASHGQRNETKCHWRKLHPCLSKLQMLWLLLSNAFPDEHPYLNNSTKKTAMTCFCLCLLHWLMSPSRRETLQVSFWRTFQDKLELNEHYFPPFHASYLCQCFIHIYFTIYFKNIL